MGIPPYGNQNLVHDLIPSICARLTPASLWWYRYDLSKVLRSIGSSRARYQVSPKKKLSPWKVGNLNHVYEHIYESHSAYTKTSTRPSPFVGLGWALPGNVAPKAHWNKSRSWKKLWSWASNPKFQADGRSRFCPEFIERNVFRKVVEQKACLFFFFNGILFSLKFVATIIAVVVFKKRDVIDYQ